MRSSQQGEAPQLASLQQAGSGSRRIVIPLHRVLGFARQEAESRNSRQLALALRPLLGMALATTGLCPEAPGAPGAPQVRGASRPPGGKPGGGEGEILFSALSSLVEVVKLLTPGTGRVYARLGHEAIEAPDDPDDGVGADGADGAVGATGRAPRQARRAGATAAAGPAARSEVIIELVSTAGSAVGLPAGTLEDFGSLAFELAVVGAIVESKGGEIDFGTPCGDARSFVVRLPVSRC